jgi:hypothetical protein
MSFFVISDNCPGQRIITIIARDEKLLITSPTPPKKQQTKMLVMYQRFGALFLFGLVWQYYFLQTKYIKGRVQFHGHLLAAVI